MMGTSLHPITNWSKYNKSLINRGSLTLLDWCRSPWTATECLENQRLFNLVWVGRADADRPG